MKRELKDKFKIYIDRLREDHPETIELTLDPSFLEVDEDGLTFLHPIQVQGSAYTTDNYLIIQLNIESMAHLPCSICNADVSLPIRLGNFYLTLPFDQIKGAVYDFRTSLREAILLEIPAFTECGGSCPERKNIDKYFSKPSATTDAQEHFP